MDMLCCAFLMTDDCTTGQRVSEAEIWPLLRQLAKSADKPKSRRPLHCPGTTQILCFADPNEERHWASTPDIELSAATRSMLDLYMPLLVGDNADDLVVAHLGQSLDSRIATVAGNSQFITGPENLLHTHRMRALFDAVVVGTHTTAHDNPRLTTRLATGTNPTRVVIDPRCTSDPEANLFTDGDAQTLTVCLESHVPKNSSHHIPLPGNDGIIPPQAIVDALAQRGLRRIFIEGGGVSVSRFLQAGVLHRLQVCVAPMIIGSGRPAFTLPEVETLCEGVFLNTTHFSSGKDILFDCQFREKE